MGVFIFQSTTPKTFSARKISLGSKYLNAFYCLFNWRDFSLYIIYTVFYHTHLIANNADKLSFKNGHVLSPGSKSSPGVASSEAETESASGAAAGRKRRWGSSTAVTAKKPSISITTDSLKVRKLRRLTIS